MKYKKISFIIPAYNEQDTITSLLENVLELKLDYDIKKELIVINDASTDNTEPILMNFNKLTSIKILNNSVNMGKGYCIRKGIANSDGDVLVIQDADLEYDPNDISRMFSVLVENNLDSIYGSRFKINTVKKNKFYYANLFLTWFSSLFTNLNITDMETCYKMFTRETINKIKLFEDRFGIEPEITAKISRLPGINFMELSISYNPRNYKKGKKIGFLDGMEAIYCILKYNIWKR